MRAIVRNHKSASFHAETDADKALLGMWAEMVAGIGSSGGPAGETNDVLICFRQPDKSKADSVPVNGLGTHDYLSLVRRGSKHDHELFVEMVARQKRNDEIVQRLIDLCFKIGIDAVRNLDSIKKMCGTEAAFWVESKLKDAGFDTETTPDSFGKLKAVRDV